MLPEIHEFLSSQMDSTLGIVVTKGFPTWARPPLVPPAIGIEIVEIAPGGTPRIGKSLTKKATTWRLSLFARNEVELCTLSDTLLDWFQANESAVITGNRCDCRLTAARRHLSETAAQQEQYGMGFYLIITW